MFQGFRFSTHLFRHPEFSLNVPVIGYNLIRPQNQRFDE